MQPLNHAEFVFVCMRQLNPHLIRLGCCGEDEAHRACLRHEDPQQVGDAEKGRGKQISVHGSLFVTIFRDSSCN